MPEEKKSFHLPPSFTTVTTFSKYLALSLFIILPLLSLFLGWKFGQQTQKATDMIAQNTPTSTATPPPQPLPMNMVSPVFSTKGFAKRQFDPNKDFFTPYGYPQEIKNIHESQLIGMRCTYNIWSPQYSGRKNYLYYVDENDFSKARYPTVVKDDAFYQSLANQIKEEIGIDPQTFMECTTENNKVLYEFTDHHKAYFALSDQAGISIVLTIPLVFGSCKPLQLTTANTLYFVCANGEQSATLNLYKTPLIKPTLTPFYSCTNGPVSSQPVVTCK